MKARGKKLLAAMLSLAMVLSMFTVPAAALDVAIGTKWEFMNSTFDGNAASSGTYEGLTFTNAGYNSGYGMALNGGGTVTVPVPGACNIKLVLGYSWNLALGDETAMAAADAGHDKEVIFHHNSTEAAVITSTGSSYIKSIELEAYAAPAAPAEVGASWDFSTLTKDDGGNYSQNDPLDSTLTGYDNLTLNSVKYHSTNYGVTMGNGGSIDITVAGDCDIRVGVGYQWNLQLGDDAATAETNPDNGNAEIVFHYNGGAGKATLKAVGTTYIKTITLEAYSAPAAPAEVGDKWDFSTLKKDDGGNYSQNDPLASTLTGYDNLTLNNVKYHSTTYGVTMGNGGSIDIAVAGNCAIKVGVGYQWNLQLGDDASTVQTNPDNGNAEIVFSYKGGAGTATLKAMGTTYIKTIELADLPQGPSLALDTDNVTVKVDDPDIKTATVTATVENAPEGTEVLAVSSDDTIATASVSGNTITITAVKAGSATVTVSLKNVEDSPEKTVAVLVKPAGEEIVAPGKYVFGTNGHDGTNVANKPNDGYKEIFGVDWGGFTWHDSQHGLGGSGSITFHLPKEGFTTLIVTTCTYGNGGDVTSDKGTVADTTAGSTGDGGKQYTISNAQGDTTVTFSKSAFIHGLTVSEPAAEVKPTLSLDKDRVELKLGETETDTVTATVENVTDPVITATPADGEATVAATVGDGGAITITAKGAGTTKVTVAVTGTDLTKDITVLVKPAGAEIVAPGKYVFGTGGHDGTNIANRPNNGYKEVIGVDWGGFTFHDGQHGLSGTGEIILHLPADKYSTIIVTTCTFGKGEPLTSSTGTVADTTAGSTGDGGKQYTISNAKGDTTITFGGTGSVYLHGLTVGEFTDEPVVPPATLALDKNEVTLKLDGKTSETVHATVENRPEGAVVKAVSKKPSVATAAVEGDTITITAVGEGDTTVEVTLDGMTNGPKETIKVYVDPAGEIVDLMAEGVIYFDQLRNADFANINFARIRGFDAPDFKVGNEHGINGKNAAITIKMAKKGSITVQGCTYGSGKALEMESSSGAVEKKVVAANNGEADTPLFFVTGAEGNVTLTFTGDAYIHYIMVEYDFEITDRRFDVWDFSGRTESGENYNNNVTPALWVESGAVANGLFNSNGDLAFGDLTINHQLNDRLYSTVSGMGTIANTDGSYTGWYCNGAGKKDTSRCITLAHVAAGDKIVAYMKGHNGDVTFHFQGVGPASAQDDTEVRGISASEPCVFVAQYSGTYKIWGEGNNKPLYQRVERYRGVEVSGSVTIPEDFGATDYAVKFINQDNGQVTFADLNGTDFSAALAPGFTYVASLSGAPGWGFTKESRFVTTTNDDTLTGKADVELVVDVKPLYTYSGTISGFAEGYDVSNLAVTMVPDETAVANGAEKVALELTGLDFTAKLDPDNVTYTLEMTGVNDYAITAPAQVSSTGADLTGQTITVEAKALQTASGKFLGLTGDAAVTALSFENVDDGYVYPATVTADGYTAKLRAGAYLAVATVEGYSTKTHVVVAEGKDTVKDLLFVSTAAKPAVEWAADVYVDPAKAGQDNTYATVREAVDAVSRMGITSEAKRVTIHIAPGTYREQVIIDTPFVTLMNDTPEEEVLITWYYGIGYKYYSSNGYYDPELAYDKFNKGIADRWGTTVRVNATATAFRAEGITFENSFNRYVTAEEIADGVEPAGNEKIDLKRTLKMDVSTNAATERAAAMCVETGEAEFYNCKFYSSQDTLYTNGTVYFKNCFIEGQTDYIYGDVNSKCVFDACTLNWKGYSANSKGGYITALRTNEGEVGYLFRNCIVSGNAKLTVTPGYFGRPWGPKAGVFFLNTKLTDAKLINPVGWYEMSGNDPANAQYKEFGTTALKGAAVDTSKRIPGTVATQAQANAVKVTDYFGSWVPYYYVAEDAEVAFAADPTVTANVELDKLYPGNILTVSYSLGETNDKSDASTIQWYRVKNGKETLVKTSTATVDKTYKLVDSDGGGKIKVVVTPATISGNQGEAKSFTLDAVVNYRTSSDMVPTGPSGGSGSSGSKSDTVTNPDGSKTTTKTDNKGNTTVTTVATDGSKVETLTTKDGDKTITVTDAKDEVQVKIQLPAAIPAPESKFADVPEGHWAEKAISDMAGLGLVKGVSDESFDMASPITRGSVATILYRLSNGAEGKTAGFTDVAPGDWYADAVAWAAGTGVVTGYSETIFAPKDSITREQFAVMLYRYAKLIGLDTAATGDLNQFGDAANVAGWAGEAMSWCVGKEILKGTGYGDLNPAGTASRAECAVMLGRFIALL